jgi:hypothetical protein
MNVSNIKTAANAASFFGFSIAENVRMAIKNQMTAGYRGMGNKAARRAGHHVPNRSK